MTQPVDRERAALEAILDALLPQLSYYVHWTYRVTGTSDGPPVTISAKSQDPRVPDLARIVLRQGPDGGYATPANGSLISVGFLNADPSLPYVHSLDPTTEVVNAWEPAQTKRKLTGGGPAAARKGDSVNCGYLVFTAASPLAISNPAFYPGTAAGKAAADLAVSGIGGSAFRLDLNVGGDGDTTTGGVITTGSAKTEIG